MKKSNLLAVVVLLFLSNSIFGQEKKFENFNAEQKKYEKEIKSFLEAKLNEHNNKDLFSDLQSNYSIAINPMGEVHDSLTYKGAPKPLGEKTNLDSLPKDKVFTISIKTDPTSQKAVVYNEGRTLVYNWRAMITSYVFGHLVKFNVTRLETYIKYKGKWMMVCGSGTESNPKWRPTPLTN